MSSNRSFGVVFFVVFMIIGFYPLLVNGESVRHWSIIVSLIFLILGLIDSRILSPLNRLWFKFGLFLGRIFSPIIMSIIFFFIVTPIAILMRLLKKDLLNLKFNNSDTYWIKKNEMKSKMKNQF